MATDDQTGTPDPEMEPVEPDPSTEGERPPADDPTKNIDGLKKALADERKWRKDNESLVKEAKARQDKDKSETQRLGETLTAAEARAEKAEAALLRYEVATSKEVPAKLVRFLTGDSKEELEEAADALLAEFDAKPSMPARPRERLAAGKPSGNADDSRTSDELASMILDRK